MGSEGLAAETEDTSPCPCSWLLNRGAPKDIGSDRCEPVGFSYTGRVPGSRKKCWEFPRCGGSPLREWSDGDLSPCGFGSAPFKSTVWMSLADSRLDEVRLGEDAGSWVEFPLGLAWPGACALEPHRAAAPRWVIHRRALQREWCRPRGRVACVEGRWVGRGSSRQGSWARASWLAFAPVLRSP